MKIAVIDYGMGNIGSIINMLKKVGVEGCATVDHEYIRQADKLILPGVGAFDHGIMHLEESGLRSPLNDCIDRGVPILGICLGMQILGDSSEEGSLKGLGWISGKTVRIELPEKEGLRYKIPHMGWNTLQLKSNSPLFDGLEENSRFYFVHSFHFDVEDDMDVAAETDYGNLFVSAVQRKNIYGVQFHPEKSHKYGLKLFSNFVEKC